MQAHRLPNRKPIEGIEGIDDLKDLLADHDVPFEQWGTEDYPQSNTIEKLSKNLDGAAYTLWLIEGGVLQRECSSLRSYVTQRVVVKGESGKEAETTYMLKEAYKRGPDGQTKRKWAIESSMGEKRKINRDTGRTESDKELLTRGMSEELGLKATSDFFDIVNVNNGAPVRNYRPLYIARESPSFPGLENVFNFTDFRLRVVDQDPQAMSGFYNVDTVTEIPEEESVVGWAWEEVVGWEKAAELLNEDSFTELDPAQHAAISLQLRYLQQALKDEETRYTQIGWDYGAGRNPDAVKSNVMAHGYLPRFVR